ncbi:MAG: HAD hydrolase-like protein, partial [Oscillospiraceae bacterium]|nr:HAD hydrolase-like protein [Oscillospiraceae bacterium]
MHYTSVLFDLDGTLLDTLGDLTAAMNRTLTRHGLPERTRQQMRTALGNGARRLMELSVPSGTDSALFETLLAEYNADYAAHCRIETAPYPGVAALL